MTDRRERQEKRGSDRRVRQDPNYTGPDRRKGDRRKTPRQDV